MSNDALWILMPDGTRVRGQVDEAILDAAKEDGVTAVICNRPDNEDPGQPSADTVKKWAEDRGMSFIFAPVSGGDFTSQSVESMKAALADNEGSLLAYCRTGNRSSNLWKLVQ